MLGRGHIVNMQYFLSSSCLHWCMVQKIKYKAIMTKEASSKIVIIITIGAWDLMLWRGYLCHYSEYTLSSFLSIYMYITLQLIAIVLREYNAVFLCHC